jgi:methylase of polypeptide subunit release factors
MAANAMLNHVDNRDLVLEPNGGDGALIKAMRNEGFKGTIYTYELNPIYQEILKELENVVFLGADFLEAESCWNGKFHRIIANPPFNKNQDIDHIYQMWDMLAPGGTIVTVASRHWQTSNNKKEKTFRTWLDEKEATIYPLDNGKFKESGTMVASCILVIDKP